MGISELGTNPERPVAAVLLDDREEHPFPSFVSVVTYDQAVITADEQVESSDGLPCGARIQWRCEAVPGDDQALPGLSGILRKLDPSHVYIVAPAELVEDMDPWARCATAECASGMRSAKILKERTSVVVNDIHRKDVLLQWERLLNVAAAIPYNAFRLLFQPSSTDVPSDTPPLGTLDVWPASDPKCPTTVAVPLSDRVCFGDKVLRYLTISEYRTDSRGLRERSPLQKSTSAARFLAALPQRTSLGMFWQPSATAELSICNPCSILQHGVSCLTDLYTSAAFCAEWRASESTLVFDVDGRKLLCSWSKYERGSVSLWKCTGLFATDMFAPSSGLFDIPRYRKFEMGAFGRGPIHEPPPAFRALPLARTVSARDSRAQALPSSPDRGTQHGAVSEWCNPEEFQYACRELAGVSRPKERRDREGKPRKFRAFPMSVTRDGFRQPEQRFLRTLDIANAAQCAKSVASSGWTPVASPANVPKRRRRSAPSPITEPSEAASALLRRRGLAGRSASTGHSTSSRPPTLRRPRTESTPSIALARKQSTPYRSAGLGSASRSADFSSSITLAETPYPAAPKIDAHTAARMLKTSLDALARLGSVPRSREQGPQSPSRPIPSLVLGTEIGCPSDGTFAEAVSSKTPLDGNDSRSEAFERALLAYEGARFAAGQEFESLLSPADDSPSGQTELRITDVDKQQTQAVVSVHDGNPNRSLSSEEVANALSTYLMQDDKAIPRDDFQWLPQLLRKNAATFNLSSRVLLLPNPGADELAEILLDGREDDKSRDGLYYMVRAWIQNVRTSAGAALRTSETA